MCLPITLRKWNCESCLYINSAKVFVKLELGPEVATSFKLIIICDKVKAPEVILPTQIIMNREKVISYNR